MGVEELIPFCEALAEIPYRERQSAEIQVKYDGYIRHQLAAVERAKKMEDKILPADMDYHAIRGLRLEAAEKLAKMRPENVGRAARISGVSPADIAVLLLYLASEGGKKDVL